MTNCKKKYFDKMNFGWTAKDNLGLIGLLDFLVNILFLIKKKSEVTRSFQDTCSEVGLPYSVVIICQWFC